MIGDLVHLMRRPKPGDILVARSSLSLWTRYDDMGYFETKNFEIGDAALLLDILDSGQHWCMYRDNQFLEYETPHVWDDDWNLLV